MAIARARNRPLVAVLSRVPLFVEALRAAFEGIADVQTVPADDVEAHGLVRAFRPDAVIIEGVGADTMSTAVPCVRVELEVHTVSLCVNGDWQRVDVELAPEAIRNLVVAELYGGDST